MYDLAIIGAGWAGFNAALKAKQAGLKACLIEKADIGGTCLNLGCIPTKTLCQSAKIYSLAKKSAHFGIEIISSHPDFIKIQERKDRIIRQLRSGMQSVLTGVDFFNAEAFVLSKNEIRAGDKTLKTKFILAACGSRPLELSAFKFNALNILSSNDMLGIKEIPQSLLIIGGGVIGIEFASIFSAFGTKVTVAEKMSQLIPGIDSEAARKIEAIFKKKGIIVKTNTDANSLNQQEYNLTLVCVGRAPCAENLGLANAGVNTERGRVIVDDFLKTSVDNIYAAGDCTAKIMLAHFAAYQGRIAVENMLSPDKPKRIDCANIPNCIFTEPEIASVGLSEDEAKNKGLDIRIDKFDFLGSGMARILEETEGFIKLVSDKKTGLLLGACIIGPKATELIGTLTLAITNRLKLSQIKDTVFGHPTLCESINEAIK